MSVDGPRSVIHRRASIEQLLISRLVCQPTGNRDHMVHWDISEAQIDGENPTGALALSGDFLIQQDGWMAGGTAGIIFHIPEEDKPADAHNPTWLADNYAQWANNLLWDHLSTSLRSLLETCLGASTAISIPLSPPPLATSTRND